MQTVKTKAAAKITLSRPPQRRVSSKRERAVALRQALLMLGPALLRVEDFTLDLPFRQLEVCLVLSGGRCAMSEIGRKLGISLSALAQVADRLERSGLVERVIDDTDRRVRLLQLTPKGSALMEANKEHQLSRMMSCLQRHSDEQSEQLLEALQRLVRIATSEMQPVVA